MCKHSDMTSIRQDRIHKCLININSICSFFPYKYTDDFWEWGESKKQHTNTQSLESRSCSRSRSHTHTTRMEQKLWCDLISLNATSLTIQRDQELKYEDTHQQHISNEKIEKRCSHAAFCFHFIFYLFWSVICQILLHAQAQSGATWHDARGREWVSERVRETSR